MWILIRIQYMDPDPCEKLKNNNNKIQDNWYNCYGTFFVRTNQNSSSCLTVWTTEILAYWSPREINHLRNSRQLLSFFACESELIDLHEIHFDKVKQNVLQKIN